MYRSAVRPVWNASRRRTAGPSSSAGWPWCCWPTSSSDEPRAAAGWGFFALGFDFFGVFGAGDTVVLLAVGSLLVAGLALQVSQRVEKRVESGGN
ncbi:hypothetical protein BRD05_05145 [Halobacteriales archaeon QS_9_70_65]|nr:MAG: hypothetical protein BRD05_05145 [Halobacteriales archaeon QS_9_70_65]